MYTKRSPLPITGLLVVLSCLCVLAMPRQAGAEESQISAEQYGTILNLSGRQRMLSQKMSKEFLLIAAGVDPQGNREQLKSTMQLFEKTLAGLRDGDAEVGLPATENALILKQLEKTQSLYEQIQPALAKAASGSDPSPEDIQLVAEQNLPVLENMNKAVKMYERRASSVLSGSDSLGVVINLAGKQRMLTQKMSKEFLLVYLGVNVEENRLNVRETASLFDRTLKGLIDGDTDLELPATTDPAISEQLDVVAKLWADFYPDIQTAAAQDAKLTPEQVAKVAAGNLPLLKDMNKAVGMYEQLAKSGSVAAAE